MPLRFHPHYERVIAKARASHERHRSPEGIGPEDVALARLYSYAYRLHTIGAFHATRVAVEALPAAGPVSEAYRRRAAEALGDLANQAMEPVPTDFRAVIGTLYRYHVSVERVLDSLGRDLASCRDDRVAGIRTRFAAAMQHITGHGGIHLAQDTAAPEQASFVVPNLGIVIVPLIYGDHHSWNLAFLEGPVRDVPTHRHHHGVEIHLGYSPIDGLTVLGDHQAPVQEAYAMPIPPETDHGWVNRSPHVHHVPFIFGSMRHGGWGVFLDVEPATQPLEQRQRVQRADTHFRQMVDLEREIDRMQRMSSSWTHTLIPYTVTDRQGSGGLELNITRINQAGYSFPVDAFRIVSVVRGQGIVEIAGIEQSIAEHDHFGIPAALHARLQQVGPAPLVVLDAVIRQRGAVPFGGSA